MRWLKLPAHGHSIDLDKIAVVHGGIDEERENRPWCGVTWESGFTVNYQGSDASAILAALEGGAPGNPARRAWHDLTTCGECRAAYHQGQDDLTAEPIRALAAAREEIAALTAQRDEARRFGEEAAAAYNESLRVVTCAFCGEAYPPDTPPTGAAILAEHVKVCPKHPMRAVEAERDAARTELERLKDAVAHSMGDALAREPDYARERPTSRYQVWGCRLVVAHDAELPRGFDAPPRSAAVNAVEKAGVHVISMFSGWSAGLSAEAERIVDDDVARDKVDAARGGGR